MQGFIGLFGGIYILKKLDCYAILGERLAQAPMSIAQLARQAGISYQRLWSGSRLTEDEVRRVLAILDKTEGNGNEVA